MNRQDELLTVLAEECAEVIVECSKIKRFGADSEYNGETALERLEKEIGDLMCMIDLLHEEDMVSFTKLDEYANMKHKKLKKWSNLID
jgi:NTP pyrophosphatase (non-canonical NTP hydrolase)